MTTSESTQGGRWLWRVHSKPPIKDGVKAWLVRADRCEQTVNAVAFTVDTPSGPFLIASFPHGQHGRVEFIHEGTSTNISVELEERTETDGGASTGAEAVVPATAGKPRNWGANTETFMRLIPDDEPIIETRLFRLFAEHMPEKNKDAKLAFNRVKYLMLKNGYIGTEEFDDEDGQCTFISRTGK